jgi:hypothetical protein
MYGIDEGGPPDALLGPSRRDRNLSKRLFFATERPSGGSRENLLAGQAVIHRQDHGVSSSA